MSANSGLVQPHSIEEDCLTAQQRTDAIAEILSTIALRIIRQRHEQEYSSSR